MECGKSGKKICQSNGCAKFRGKIFHESIQKIMLARWYEKFGGHLHIDAELVLQTVIPLALYYKPKEPSSKHLANQD